MEFSPYAYFEKSVDYFCLDPPLWSLKACLLLIKTKHKTARDCSPNPRVAHGLFPVRVDTVELLGCAVWKDVCLQTRKDTVLAKLSRPQEVLSLYFPVWLTALLFIAIWSGGCLSLPLPPSLSLSLSLIHTHSGPFPFPDFSVPCHL